MELKNEYDLIKIKFQRVNDENYNIKRDLLLFEKEIKSKNDLIEKLKHEILSSSKVNYYDYKNEFNSNNIENESNITNELINPITTRKRNSEVDIFIQNSSRQIKKISTDKTGNNTFTNDKLDNSLLCSNSTKSSVVSQEIVNKSSIISNKKNFETRINILPSEKDMVRKETKILEIETKLYSLQQDREKIQSELSRLPEYPKQKAQILKKKDYELAISEYNKQINSLKVELREMNAIYK